MRIVIKFEFRVGAFFYMFSSYVEKTVVFTAVFYTSSNQNDKVFRGFVLVVRYAQSKTYPNHDGFVQSHIRVQLVITRFGP